MDRQTVQEAQVRIVRAGWNEPAARFLAPAIKCDKGATVETLKSRVEAGEAALFNVVSDDYIVGAYVLAIDKREKRSEGEIIAAGGKLSGQKLLNLLPFIESQLVGVSCVRFSTARPGMVRQAKKQGYKVAEILMIKEL